MVNFLIENGSDVKAEGSFELRALWLAQVIGQRDIMRILKEAGAR
jgi:hypothetical protein